MFSAELKEKFSKKTICVYATLALIVLSALILRLWLVSGHHLIFFYDQARDAVHANNIANGDLMIFGPSASGTNDTFYHGAIWYYFLAPWYAISADPQNAVNALVVLSSLYLVVIFYLAKKILKSPTGALIVTILMAFSSLVTTNVTWISNPSLVYFFFPPFIYFAYRYWQKMSLWHFILTALFLGLLIQAAISQAYWGILLIIIFVRHFREPGKWKTLVAGGATLLLSTSSMILVQALLIKRGILTFQGLRDFNTKPITTSLNDALLGILNVYGTTLARSLFPAFLVASFLLIVVMLIWYCRKKTSNRNFFLVVGAVPLIFLTIVFRNSPHSLAGFEFVLYLVLIDLAIALKKSWGIKIVLSVSLLIFIVMNSYQLFSVREHRSYLNSIQKGVVLADQLELIDETYRRAAYQPFTFSANTVPSFVNVTWHYLYSWYGKEKYGYTPIFIGPSQLGYPHYGLIEETENYVLPYATHFTIMEPDTGLDPRLETKFLEEQYRLAGTPSAGIRFSELQLLVY